MKRLIRLMVCACFLFVLSLVGAVSQGGMLRFVSQQHVLGFGVGDWFVARGAEMLRVAFVGANRVLPTSGTATDGHASNAGAPVDVMYANLWNGIDVTYRATGQGIVESVYEVAPYADVNAIRLRYSAPVALRGDGTLASKLERGQLTESAPLAWQEVAGARVAVPIAFVVEGREVAFAVGAFDTTRVLYIDPTLTWNTFLGSVANDSGNAVAADALGNVYVVGNSDATWGTGAAPQGCVGCPKRAYTALQDVFVAKLDAAGNLVWNTFLGGAETDFGGGIAVDGTPTVYVSGTSNATWGSPVRAYTASDDAFAVQLNATTGALGWSTFLGGSDADSGNDIAVDSAGTNVYVGGSSRAAWGTGAPPQGCAGCPVRAFSTADNGFAAKLTSAGALTWNTFLGGTGNDSAAGVAVDSSGNVYVGGTSDDTWGAGDCPGCPIRPYSSGNDAYAAKLSSAGVLTWNTFLGGSATDLGSGIAVNSAGTRIYMTGASTATWGAVPFRAFTGGGADVFAAEVNSAGALAWNGFLGGAGTDSVGRIATDSNANVYVAGSTDASWGTGAPPQGCAGCPVRAYSPNTPSPVDAFAVKIGDQTTAVNVANLSGRVGKAGAVVLKWRTTTETQIAGFNVYRKLEQGTWTRVNANFLQAKFAGNVAGARYRFADTLVRMGKTYRYKIEAVYLDNHSEWTRVILVQTSK